MEINREMPSTTRAVLESVQRKMTGAWRDGTPLVIEVGHGFAAIGRDCPRARYAPSAMHRDSRPASGEPMSGGRRAFVEIFQRAEPPRRALLGGTLSPGTDHTTQVVVQVSEDRPSGAPRTYPSAFRHDLVPGLLEEYAKAVPAALMTHFARPGVITIDRGAHDEVDSSVLAFSLAADLLGLVLRHESPREAEAAVRRRLADW